MEWECLILGELNDPPAVRPLHPQKAATEISHKVWPVVL